MALPLKGFLSRQLKAAQAVRAQGGAVTPWLMGRVVKRAGEWVAQLDAAASAGPELSATLRSQPRLNFGCGYDKRPGYLNVDSDPACRPDVLVGPHLLAAFPSRFYESIVAKDVLEHIPRTQSQRVLLQFADWLREGGTLELQTSSIAGVAKLLEGRRDFEFQYGMVNCLFGTQAHPGDFHFTGFTDVTLKVMLHASGFQFGEFELIDGWMFRVKATKVSDWYRWSGSEAAADFEREVFADALGRSPQPHESQVLAEITRREGRRAAALEIFQSYERLVNVARARGFC